MASISKFQMILIVFSMLTLLPCLVSASINDEDPSSVYQILPQFGLPSGLLPDSVKSYTLSDDGNFVVELANTCYVQFDYLVYYEKKVTGKLQYGSITNLKGIEVKRFLFWFDVDEIRVDLPPNDNIYFQVGIINKKLELDQFKTVHSCRDKKVFSAQPGLGLELPTPVEEIEMLITE